MQTNIVTFNCQSLASAERKNQMSKLLNDLNAQLACLQETRHTDLDNKQFTYEVPAPNQTSNQKPCSYTIYAGSADNGYGGCAIAVRSDLNGLVSAWGAPNCRLTYVHFKRAQQPTWVISAYAPTRDADDAVKDEFYEGLKTLLDRIPRRHIVMLGMDANAQFGPAKSSPSLGRWYYPAEETNDNGSRLLELAVQYNLCIANTIRRTRRDQRITWTSGATTSRDTKAARRSSTLKSQIDYLLISSAWAPMVEKAAAVKRAPFPSDHRPVTVRVKNRYVAPRKERRVRHDVERLNDGPTLKRYQDAVLEQLFPPGRQRRNEISVTPEDFTEAVLKARNACVPEIRAEKQKPLVSAAAERLLTQLAESRRTGDERAQRRTRNALRRRLRQDRELIWERRIEDMSDAWKCGNSRKVYALLRRYGGKLKAGSDTLEANGTCVANEECLDAWRLHFSQLLNRPPPTGEPLRTPEKPPYQCSEEPPSLEEVEAAIRKMKNRKAAGEDGVQPELLKALPPLAVTTFTGALKSIWTSGRIPENWRTAVVIPLHKKGPVTDPTNYRGISLLDVQYKILERIIADRLIGEREVRTREEQAGFRPGRSTTDQIFVLRRILETRNRYKQPLAVAFLDFACAFDSPDRERIYDLLRSDGVPEKIVQLIREMNSDSAAVVRTRSGCSRPFNVATGVRQGSTLGPMLFNYVIDAIMNEATKEFGGGITLLPSTKKLTDLDYADDLALLSDSWEELQRFIDRVAELAERFGLRLKPSKCKLISTFPDADQPICVYGEAIEEVPSFCYLGSIIAANGSVKEDVTQRIAKARAAFAMLHRCLWKSNVSREMKLRVYITAIRPILSYAAETWQLTQAEEKRLDTAELSLLRQVIGAHRRKNDDGTWTTPSNEYVRSQVNATYRIQPLSEHVRKNRLRLLGHVLRRSDERLTKIALGYPGDPAWKRPPGGTRKTWPEYVKQDLERMKIREQFRGTEVVTYWNRGSDWLRVTEMLAHDRAAWQTTIVEKSGREANSNGSRSDKDPS
ncbi:endonuclease-reverse transcriptase [Aphelenchoides avenae]|nr:endonuclease-reverse transcriptase [Aphelenchus avenae]